MDRPLRSLTVAAVVVALLVGSATPSQAAAPTLAAPPAPTVDRVNGTTVYTVAVAASKLARPTDGTGTTVVVASGLDFLSGALAGAAAASMDGQLLLTEPTVLTAVTKAELQRLAPDRIVVVGNSAAVSAAVEAQLRMLQADTVRIAGTDLYNTSVLLAAHANQTGASRAFVTGGSAVPSLMSAAALAGSQHAPLVIVRPSDAAVRPDLSQLLGSTGADSVTIVGAPAAVSASFATAVQGTGRTVDRIVGADYVSLSYAIAARFDTPQRVFALSGSGYPIGVAAIPLAAAATSPIVFTTAYCAVPALTALVAGATAPRITLVGSVVQIRTLVGSLPACLSVTAASSYWVIANKRNKLNPVTYTPSGLRLPAVQRTGAHYLRSAAASAIENLNAGSIAAGAGRIGVVSGYRSYNTQKSLYARYVATRGQAWADSQSARAGFSEHQTGLAADVAACSATSCGSIYSFAATPQGAWVKNNAWRYGLVVRYESGYTSTTGYASEPWHLRFIGIPAATDYRASGFHTLENYFGYAAAPNYR